MKNKKVFHKPEFVLITSIELISGFSKGYVTI